MKIAVFSDTHGESSRMIDILYETKPDTVIHLGDYSRDTEDIGYCFPMLPLISVPGNCDYSRETGEREVVFFGKRFFITHGHRFGVKSGTGALLAEGKRREADVILFGHTHRQMAVTDESGILLLNPGAGRNMGTPYAEIYCEPGEPLRWKLYPEVSR